jgi:hypothetical protein
MEREPRNRYASASELRHALERSATALHEAPTVAAGTTPLPKRRISPAALAIVCLLLIAAAATPFVWRWRAHSITGSKAAALPRRCRAAAPEHQQRSR